MKSYNLHEWIETTLIQNNFVRPTNIQRKLIPLGIRNKSIIGVAPTGTGKTLAYLLPILQNIDYSTNKYQALIILPTRELARQTISKIEIFKKNNKKLKTQLWIGGEEISKQISSTNNGSQILVTTPNRFLKIYEQSKIDLSSLKTIVLDETDMLLDLGFFKEIDQIFNIIKNKEIQKIALSATIHNLLSQQLAKYFTNTKEINVSKSIYENENIKHYLLWTKDKYHALATIANTTNPYLCLIFANTKKQADEIYKYLKSQNRSVIHLHGGLKTRERKNNYKSIQRLDFQYVVASDLASRGLDIEGASHVISWNLPDDPEWYVHRAGRAGRSKYEGISYVFQNNEEDAKVLKLQKKGVKFINMKIKNNALEKTNQYVRARKPKISEEQIQEINNVVKNQKKKIKPGYKKKLSKEIQKINQKYKREHLEKVIKQKRVEGYKRDNAKNK